MPSDKIQGGRAEEKDCTLKYEGMMIISEQSRAEDIHIDERCA